MDSMHAFAMGQANRGKPLRVFDWDLAAKILKDRKPERASAGLQSDREWTEYTIWKDGVPYDEEVGLGYLMSTWAIPILIIDDEEIPCWIWHYQKEEWDAKTHWPDSARKILTSEEVVG